MISETVSIVFMYIMSDRIKKDDCIRIAYRNLNAYKVGKLDGKVEHPLSSNDDYKLKAITAYITMKCGFPISKKKILTHQLMFQATRNALK